MSSVEYEEFNDVDYSLFRKNLLRTKGGSQQREFLKITRNNENFLNFIREKIKTNGSYNPQICQNRLTENEFKDPPANTEIDLYNAWAELTPRIACRTTFWANLTCRHIENGKINAVYLAANGGSHPGGAERIDLALQSDETDAAKPIDGCVRTVLRRLSGLLDARGHRSVYVDCPLARAWWRERLVAEISQGDENCAEKVRRVIRINPSYWEKLVELVVSRNSVLGSHTVRDAFILSLADLLEKEQKTPLQTAKELGFACRAIGIIQASRELSVLDEDEIHALMSNVVKLRHEHALDKRK